MKMPLHIAIKSRQVLIWLGLGEPLLNVECTCGNPFCTRGRFCGRVEENRLQLMQRQAACTFLYYPQDHVEGRDRFRCDLRIGAFASFL